ncbi:hypothetical protein SKAU_G00298980 [Synaphobranchus kaupii]|uniref:Ubiquitin carboxyl-terminal hydrolase n=1 Tax=Synaphobranchus kaupii TaxID=118154 RepID=A0A9Q1EVA5_SYNKA|nr:hypothetical protein SKAU_G00298980 [Synaphobranchus kaupii]
MYIFGEFSPDEFNQFFVTPRCLVELPPFNDKVPSVSQSSGSYCTPAVPYYTETVRRQVCGEEYQHIEFGVDEVIEQESLRVKESLQRVSSTLNPQAPEFILGCQPSPKAPQDLQQADEADGCPDSEGPLLDGAGGACQDLEGAAGGLGQRERKKKKKRPPGYYNYLEGSGGDNDNDNGNDNGNGDDNGDDNGNGDGDDCDGSAPLGDDAPLGAGLVNGHVPSAPGHGSESDVAGETVAEAASPSRCSPADEAPPPPHRDRRRQRPEDLREPRRVVLGLHERRGLLVGHSGVAEGGRTAEQPQDAPGLESPELLGSGRDSPSPTSPPPPPPSTAAAPPPLPAPITALSPSPSQTTATTDQEEAGDGGVPNGPTDPLPHKDSLEPGEPQSQPPQAPSSPCPEAQPAAEQAQSPLSPAGPQAPNAPKSWASLFHNSKPLPGGPQAYVEVKNVPAPEAPAPPAAQTPEMAADVREGPVHMSEDAKAPRLAELIENVKLLHKPVSLQPRGLINRGNWCYINATLQALVACPPMFHLMKSIPALSESQRQCSSTPMIDNFVRLVNEFSNMPVPSKAKQQAAGDNKIMKDVRPGVPFEPTYIYRLLTVVKSSISEKVNPVTALGRQEDAEEYLGFILNGLHEEMLALKKLISPEEEKAPALNGPESQPGAPDDSAEREEDGSEDEWEQVGPRNKTSVTRQADFVRTPITDIFGGHIRSVVYQHSSKESATLQPFFTLQLDIQSEKVRTVQEALEALVARESVQGYTTKTKQEIEISRRVTLEELPPVLVLHLKRFVFEKTGGCQKLNKNIDYPVDLEISKDLLSPGVRGKIFKGHRTYRLFAVVYHHGNSATGGHYTTDVFHIGLNGWLRIDDQAVKVIMQHHVVKQTAERTAYLLYYRRVDQL